MIEDAVNVAIGLEAIVAVWLVWRAYREWRFLDGLRPHMDPEGDLPLYDALNSRAIQVTTIGAYLLLITAFGAVGIRLADIFPPIRAINGGLILVLIAGPAYIGREMRRRVKADIAANGEAT